MQTLLLSGETMRVWETMPSTQLDAMFLPSSLDFLDVFDMKRIDQHNKAFYDQRNSNFNPIKTLLGDNSYLILFKCWSSQFSLSVAQALNRSYPRICSPESPSKQYYHLQ